MNRHRVIQARIDFNQKIDNQNPLLLFILRCGGKCQELLWYMQVSEPFSTSRSFVSLVSL